MKQPSQKTSVPAQNKTSQVSNTSSLASTNKSLAQSLAKCEIFLIINLKHFFS